MTHTKQKLPSLKDAKAQAKRLRVGLSESETPISHSASLELIACQLGFKDWNTLHAAIGNEAPENSVNVDDVNIGAMVKGRYLGQPFLGEVLGIKIMDNSNRFRLTLDLETPVDVVTFDSFSSFRKRISCTVDRSGVSAERTSNGVPQMILNLGVSGTKP